MSRLGVKILLRKYTCWWAYLTVCTVQKTSSVMRTLRNLNLPKPCWLLESTIISLVLLMLREVLLAPAGQSHLISVGFHIVVCDEAQDGHVVRKLKDDIGSTVMTEQGIKEGTEHTALRCTCVEDREQEVWVPIKKSNIQLKMEVCSSRSMSLELLYWM